jgi:hypothetical protein
VAILLFGSLGACSFGDEPPKVLKISGDCALDDADERGGTDLPLTDLIPKKLLLHVFGPGDYDTTAGMIYKDRKLPTAYDSRCALTRSTDGQDVLRFALVNPKDPSYADAQKQLAQADAQGYTLVNDHTFAATGASDTGAAYVTSILPDRVIFIQILHPAKGVKAIDEAAGLMAELTKSVSGISRIGA